MALSYVRSLTSRFTGECKFLYAILLYESTFVSSREHKYQLINHKLVNSPPDSVLISIVVQAITQVNEKLAMLTLKTWFAKNAHLEKADAKYFVFRGIYQSGQGYEVTGVEEVVPRVRPAAEWIEGNADDPFVEFLEHYKLHHLVSEDFDSRYFAAKLSKDYQSRDLEKIQMKLKGVQAR